MKNKQTSRYKFIRIYIHPKIIGANRKRADLIIYKKEEKLNWIQRLMRFYNDNRKKY